VGRLHELILVAAECFPEEAPGAITFHGDTQTTAGDEADLGLGCGQPVENQAAGNFAGSFLTQPCKLAGPAQTPFPGPAEARRISHAAGRFRPE
jgi:hypothetical protein